MHKTLTHKHFHLTLLFLAFAGAFATQSVSAQDVWSGLKEPQSVLPKGNAPLQTATPLPYKLKPGVLERVNRNEWIISDGWTLRAGEASGKWASQKFNATVPGTILTTLIDQGVYPDPSYGLNNMSIPDSLSKMDWWYEVYFAIPQECKDVFSFEKRSFLLFNGINYRAEIFINNTQVGQMKGAFERGLFDITSIVKKYEKEEWLLLKVHIFPLEHPGIPHEQSITEGQGLNGGATSLDGPTFIASVGWDWMPAVRDRNVGLWQDVRILSRVAVTSENPLIITDLPLPKTNSADIRIEIPLHNHADYIAKGSVIATILPCGDSDADEIEISLPYSIAPGASQKIIFSPKTHPQLHILNPRLWWPNGYGEASLYELTLKIEEYDKDGNESLTQDISTTKFGIRELSYELMAHDSRKGNQRIEYNPNNRYIAATAAKKPSKSLVPMFDNEVRVLVSKEKNIYIPSFAGRDRQGITPLPQDDPVGDKLVIKVNGKRIFCRGGNWGMDDFLKRSSRERLEPHFKRHKDLNFNIIRNWTGESTQESFYQLCDEYGMLVWNDFWMTGEDTVGPEDFNLFLSNATDVVRRFRHHPSIAVWGPRNEGFAPKGLEKMLAEMVAAEDPSRHYHGQSRFLNMGTSGPWSYFEDPSYYFRERADGFNTEMGSFAIPTASTIRKFIAPEDRWPINDVWAYHDLHHTSQNFKGFMKAVEAAGGLPEGLKSPESLEKADSLMEIFANAAQEICYTSWRAMLEAWNSRMWNNTTGLILWMSHPAWPSFIWQTYTSDGGTPGSYYGAKKACEPLHIQMNPGPNDTTSAEVEVINTTLKDELGLVATARYYTIKGKLLYEVSSTQTNGISFKAPASSRTFCFPLEVPEDLPESYMIRLELTDSYGKLLSLNDYWKGAPYTEKDYLRYPEGSDDVEESLPFGLIYSYEDSYIEVQNFSDYIFRHVSINSTKVLSDNYFNLLPGETRRVQELRSNDDGVIHVK